VSKSKRLTSSRLPAKYWRRLAVCFVILPKVLGTSASASLASAAETGMDSPSPEAREVGVLGELAAVVGEDLLFGAAMAMTLPGCVGRLGSSEGQGLRGGFTAGRLKRTFDACLVGARFLGADLEAGLPLSGPPASLPTAAEVAAAAALALGGAAGWGKEAAEVVEEVEET